MSYGTIKVDTITFTDGGVDKSVSVSGLTQNPTFTGNITVTGTVSGDLIQGQTVSGATVTGDAGQFTNITGDIINATTITGVSGVFTSLSGSAVVLSSGAFGSGTAALPSVSVGTTSNGVYSPGTNQLGFSTSGTGRLFISSSGTVGVGAAAVNNFDVVAPLSPTVSIRNTTASTSTSTLKLEGYRNIADIGRLGELSFINTRDGDEQASIEVYADGDTEGKFIFKSSTNSLIETTNSFTRILVSGYENFRVNAAGVGVGTPTPTFSNGSGIEIQASGTACLRLDSSGASKAGEIYCDSEGLTLDSRGTGGTINFDIAGSSKVTIDNSGRLYVGTNDQFTAPINQLLSVADTAGSAISSVRFGNNANPTYIQLGKSRGTSIGTYTSVSGNDEIARLIYVASDGTDLNSQVASISVRAGSTISSGSVPGRILFATTLSGGTSPQEQARIDERGTFIVGGTSDTIATSDTEQIKLGGLTYLVGTSGTSGKQNGRCRLTYNAIPTSLTADKAIVGTSSNDYMPASYAMLQGSHIWYTTTGTYAGGDTINWTQSLKITPSGTVQIGDTTDTGEKVKIAGAYNQVGLKIASGAESYSSPFIIATANNVERMRVDGSGCLLLGSAVSQRDLFRNVNEDSALQVQAVSGIRNIVSIIAHNSASTAANGAFVMARSRGTAANSFTIVQSGDRLGYLSFQGADGNTFTDAGGIAAEVDGAPNASGMPSRLVFSTNNTTTDPTERLRIDRNGNIVTDNGNEIRWNTYRGIQIGNNAFIYNYSPTQDFRLISNGWYDSGTWKRATAGGCSKVFINGTASQVRMEVASSGAVNSTFSWTTVARFDSDGLKFGTDTAAANALDDYEEGTLSPLFASDGVTIVQGQEEGKYVKIGQLVYYCFNANATTASASGPNVIYVRLPFAATTATYSHIGEGSLASLNGLPVKVQAIAGVASGTLVNAETGVNISPTSAGITSNNVKTFKGAIVYRANA